jgi:DNA replication and repair protein RecF
MTIDRLSLTNFRSYEDTQFALDPSLTIVAGPNASGKTNLLEGLYALAITKSFRAKDRELVRHGSDFFRIVVRSEEVEYALGLQIVSGRLEKKVTHDNVPRTLAAHVGLIPVTLFEPADLELVSGPPEGRRRYLDFMLMQTDRTYLKTLQSYRRVLKQRNALLGDEGYGRIQQQIFAWDIQLTQLAVEIYDNRQRLLAQLNRAVPVTYGEIAGESQDIEFVYEPSILGDYTREFAEQLSRNLSRDIAAGFTTIGPHREDFGIRFAGREITTVASRGEVRTAVLAMKMAELSYIELIKGTKSLLLLDDVFSELDKMRRKYLIERLGGHQTVITTTDADIVTREFNVPHHVISTEAGKAYA